MYFIRFVKVKDFKIEIHKILGGLGCTTFIWKGGLASTNPPDWVVPTPIFSSKLYYNTACC